MGFLESGSLQFGFTWKGNGILGINIGNSHHIFISEVMAVVLKIWEQEHGANYEKGDYNKADQY